LSFLVAKKDPNPDAYKTLDELMPISIEMIRANCPFDFDLFVKIADKYLKYIPKGQGIEEEKLDKIKQIESLKSKDVERLFIPKADAEAFEGYFDDSIEEAIESEDLEAEERFSIIEEIATTAVEVIFSEPESKQAFVLTEKAAKGLRKIIQDNPKALKKIFSKKGKKTDLIENHCKNVSALSVRLAFAMGYRGKDLDHLGAAALVHDIGLSSIRGEELNLLFGREDRRMSPDDKRMYQPHVKDAVRILSNKSYINPEILKLVECHHEKLQGEGYPQKLQKMDDLSQILSMINLYDKKVSVYRIDPVEAYQQLLQQEMGHYKLNIVKKLKDVLEAEEIF
jgi:HD-GYP domain-containing protein (c-di-GMP phosphodiesterase class II)